MGGRRSRFLQQQGGQEAPREMLHPEARGCGGCTNHAAVVAGPQRLPSLRGQDNKGEALLSHGVSLPAGPCPRACSQGGTGPHRDPGGIPSPVSALPARQMLLDPAST